MKRKGPNHYPQICRGCCLCRASSAHSVTSSPTTWWVVYFRLMALLRKGRGWALNSSAFQLILDSIIRVWPHANLKVQMLSYFGNGRKGILYLISPRSFTYKNSWTDFPNTFPKISCLGWAQPWKVSLWRERPEKVIKGKWKPGDGNTQGSWEFNWLFLPGDPFLNNRKMKPKQTVSRIISFKSYKLLHSVQEGLLDTTCLTLNHGSSFLIWAGCGHITKPLGLSFLLYKMDIMVLIVFWWGRTETIQLYIWSGIYVTLSLGIKGQRNSTLCPINMMGSKQLTPWVHPFSCPVPIWALFLLLSSSWLLTKRKTQHQHKIHPISQQKGYEGGRATCSRR